MEGMIIRVGLEAMVMVKVEMGNDGGGMVILIEEMIMVKS